MPNKPFLRLTADASLPPMLMPLIMGATTALFFIVDLVTPLGIAIAFGYVFVVLLGMFEEGYKLTLSFTVICIALTVLGYFYSPDPVVVKTAVISNRLIIIGGITLTATFIINFKKLIRRLQARESLLLSILSSANEAVFVLNSQGEIMYNNKQALRMFGYNSDELNGKNAGMLAQMGQEEEVNRLMNIFEDLPHSQNPSTAIEILGKRKNGTVFPVNVNLGYFTNKDGSFFTCFAMDITKRKEAENEAKSKNEELEKSEKFLYSIVQNLPLEIIVQDAVTKTIVLENSITFKLSAKKKAIKKCITAAELLKTNVLSKSVELIKEANDKVLLTGQRITIAELPVKTDNGEEIVFRCLKAPIAGKNKKPQYIINICEDVTERIMARRELENTNQLLLETQEIGNVGIFERNLADHTFKVSKEMVKILGYEPPASYTDENRFDYIHPDDRPKILKGLNEAIRNHTILDLKYRVLRPNNEVRYVWSRSKAFYDADGRPVMLRGLITDITEIKKAEIEREENIKSLREMLFMTSHKVRVPIANILGIYNLLDNMTDPEKLKKSIGFIKNSVDSLDAFTRELTAFMEQLKAEKELGTATPVTI